MVTALLILANAVPAAGAVTPVEAGTVVRCKREPVTGSLMAERRTCHTVDEWRQINMRANNEVKRVIQPIGSNG